MTPRGHYDIVVVGAGPAGMAAATEAARHGASVLVADENQGPGGQVHRAVTTTPLQRRGLLGADYWRGEALAEAFARSGADYLPGATVWHLDAGRRLGLSVGGEAHLVQAGQVVLATGALERPFPVRGWTLPGVVSRISMGGFPAAIYWLASSQSSGPQPAITTRPVATRPCAFSKVSICAVSARHCSTPMR